MLVLTKRAAKELIKNDNDEYDFLTSYQKFILEYFHSNEFKDKILLLLYMEVGTGKTLTSLSCGISGIKSGMFKRIVILSPKSVQDEFVKNLEMFNKLSKVDKFDVGELIMIPYNANNSSVQFKALGDLENSLFIIDEAHLFMKSVIKVSLLPNSEVRNIGNAKKIYDAIRKLKNKKILLLTGTPCTKHPFETVPMWNLAGCELPKTFNDFCDEYVDGREIKHKNELKKKLNGLVAYVGVHNLPKYKGQVRAEKLKVIDVEMSENQYKQYLVDYKLELDEKGFTNKKNIYGLPFGMKSSFHAKTFEDSVYWNDELTNKLHEDRYVGEIKIDKEHTPKVIKMYEDSKNINGLCVFYFRFVKMYGCDTMVKLLEQEGYKRCEKEGVFDKKDKRYVLFTGDISYSTRIAWKNIFNDKRNMQGEYVKYLILSPSGSVGVTLKNVRYLGIGSCEFQLSTLRQIMGRCNRLNSHLDLEDKDRTLVNYLYLASKNKKYYKNHTDEVNELCKRTAPDWSEQAPTIERCIYQDSLIDDEINESFRSCLREISIIK